jgi:NitT/TauT family transport system ATP-binding protein
MALARGATATQQSTGSPFSIELQEVWKEFPKPNGERYTTLGGISLQVERGSFVSIVGPSGCGKTTLLRIIAGLISPSQGEVRIEGQPVRGIAKGIGFLFQTDALLPWRTVEGNIALPLKLRGVRGEEVRERVAAAIARVGLRGFERHYPAQLSIGMRQRVALAQTLISDPRIILMDEPFAHLDAQMRRLMAADLLDLCGQGDRTVVFVTHDLDEAIALADRVIMLSAGPAARIRLDERVPLPRPRDMTETRSDPLFLELSRVLWHALYEEVKGVYAR